MKKILTLFLVIFSLFSIMTAVNAADDYYVFDASDILGCVTSTAFKRPTELLKANDTVYYRLTTMSSGTADDNTGFDVKPADIDSSLMISEYHYIKIGYRSNIADTSAVIDMNVGLNYSGKSTRLWGISFNYDKSGENAELLFDLSTKATGGEGISGYDFNNVDTDSPANYIRIKPYYFQKNKVEGEYFDIEYIAFFKDMETASDFEFSFNFDRDYTSLYLTEQVRRTTVGDTIKMNLAYFPTYLNAPVGVVYTSSVPSVASVDADGKVTAHSAGTAVISASYGTFSSTCKVIVLANELSPVTIVSKNIENEADNVIVSALGDSITTYAPNPNGGMNYHDWWAEDYYVTNEDKGYSGTTLGNANGFSTSFIDRYPTMRDDADLITVKGGTNDFGCTSVGSSTDRITTTYKGALRILMEGLIEKYPDRQIVFFTPIKRCENNQTVNTKNGFGDTLNDFANAVVEIGAVYGIPTVNLYTADEVDFTSKVISTPYTDDDGVWHDAVCESELMPDGLHPSGKGQKILSAYMMSAMKKLGVVKLEGVDDALCGDVDADGDVDSTDLVTLSRYTAKWDGYGKLIESANADLNSDGSVNASDTVILSRHLADWNGYDIIPLV